VLPGQGDRIGESGWPHTTPWVPLRTGARQSGWDDRPRPLLESFLPTDCEASV